MGKVASLLWIFKLLVSPFTDPVTIFDFSDIWPIEMLRRNHLLQYFHEVFVIKQAIVVYTLFQKETQVVEHPLLELDGLKSVLLINASIQAASEIRLSHKMNILCRLAPHFDWQLILARIPRCYLKEHDSKGKNIGGGRCLQKLDIHLLILLIALIPVLVIGHRIPIGKALHFDQVICHIGRQVLDAVGEQNLVGILDIYQGGKADKLHLENILFS